MVKVRLAQKLPSTTTNHIPLCARPIRVSSNSFIPTVISSMYGVQKPDPLNSRIPFEVLWAIFDLYAESDGRENPLEKLLSVCQTWRAAACHHQSLWSSFRIKIQVDEDVRFWHSRIPSRLDRCGDGLVDIEVEVGLLATLSNDIGAIMQNITRLLIGKEGKMVGRWRRLCVDMPPTFSRHEWRKALSNPTPNLRFLRIRRLPIHGPILPFAPSLEELQVYSLPFEISGTLDRLKSLRLFIFDLKTSGIEAVLSSPSLIHLELFYVGSSLRFPSIFHNLESVHLFIKFNSDLMQSFTAPRLRSICLWIGERDQLSAVMRCPGVNIQRLETVGLNIMRSTRIGQNEVSDILKEVKRFIRELAAVTTLRALNPRALRVMLLCFRDGIITPTQERGYTLNLDYYTIGPEPSLLCKFRISPGSTEVDFQSIRQATQLPLEDSWEAIITTMPSPSQRMQ
jgi:hypothetical protein